jgi:hypothetical protein
MGINLAELRRKENLLAERKFREYVLMLEGLLLCMAAAGILFVVTQPMQTYQPRVWLMFAYIALCCAAAIVGVPVVFGVYRMQPWTRRPLLLMCFAAVPIFPFGTLFSLTIVAQLFAPGRPRILTDEYFALVQKTSHLNPRVSLLTWIGLCLIVALIVATIVIVCVPPETWFS